MHATSLMHLARNYVHTYIFQKKWLRQKPQNLTTYFYDRTPKWDKRIKFLLGICKILMMLENWWVHQDSRNWQICTNNSEFPNGVKPFMNSQLTFSHTNRLFQKIFPALSIYIFCLSFDCSKFSVKSHWARTQHN